MSFEFEGKVLNPFGVDIDLPFWFFERLKKLHLLERDRPTGKMRIRAQVFGLMDLWDGPDFRPVSVDKTKTESDSRPTHGEARRLRRAEWSSTATRKGITPGFRASAHMPISWCGTIPQRSHDFLTQPAANRIDDAALRSSGMIPIVLTRSVWAQSAASPVCLSQVSRGFDLRDKKRRISGSNGANERH